MPGFSDTSAAPGVMFADNVDFSGGSPPSKQITADGQLLIGSGTPPNIRAGTLGSSDGSITWTPGSGTLTGQVTTGTTVGKWITGNDGNKLSPSLGNWNILGPNSALTGFSPWTTGSGSTLTVNMPGTAKWVVNPVVNLGTHTTIQAAITAASSGDTVFITDGTYTENPVLKAGVNLVAYDANALTPNVTIVGKCTMTTAGTVSISGIRLQTNSDFLLAVTGSAASIVILENCYLNCSNNTGISHTTSNGSSEIRIFKCIGDLGTTGIGLYSSTSAGNIRIKYSNFTNSGSSLIASTNSGAGAIFLHYCYLEFLISNSGTAAGLQIFGCFFNTGAFNTTVIVANSTVSGGGSVDYTFLDGGTATAITIGAGAQLTLRTSQIGSTNTNAISGSGALIYGVISFTGTSSLISTTTQTPIVFSNNAVAVVSASGASYTTKPQDAVILVDGNVTATIVPLTSPTKGQMHRIKDSAGTAAANNITVTPSGKNIDGAASHVISTNYGSIDIVYNGTEWSVL